MKQIKVSEATPIQLDWLVAKCEGFDTRNDCTLLKFEWPKTGQSSPPYPTT